MPINSPAPLVRFSKNEIGRDFVCGDIHGCFGQLKQLMHDVGFNEKTDRLFALGDLVDRGPNSLEALQWLQYPWFHSIMGNHELLLLWSTQPPRLKKIMGDAYQAIVDLADEIDNTPKENYWNRYWGQIWFNNGGQWWHDVSTDDRQQLIELMSKLPLVIELEIGDKVIGLVHADASVDNWQDITDQLSSISNDIADWTDESLVQMLVWDRTRIIEYSNGKYVEHLNPGGVNYTLIDAMRPIEGIDHVYFGHSIVHNGVITFSNMSYIDTSAYKHKNLTLINLTETHLGK
jgi:serine/threonine protein phosphatase 1